MSHKLVSNQAVIYDAQTQASSIVTITAQSTTFLDAQTSPSPENTHTVGIYSIIWANYDLPTKQSIGSISLILDANVWSDFYDTQKSSFLTTSSYDNVIETSLAYIQETQTPLFGLPSSSWTIEM